MGKSDRHWQGFEGRPPFEVGDMIVPNGNYEYKGNHNWPKYESRRVERVMRWTETSDNWTLSVYNPSLGKWSEYNPRNFRVCKSSKESKPVATEKTQYFAMEMITMDDGRMIASSADAVTPLRDSKHYTARDVSERIQEGETWIVVHTVQKMVGKPIRQVNVDVTEYR